jgi:hypothetical protein
MDRLDIIRMAREAGFMEAGHPMNPWSAHTEQIEAFAALVAAAERERLVAKFMEIHNAQQHRNNYFAFAARVIREKNT